MNAERNSMVHEEWWSTAVVGKPEVGLSCEARAFLSPIIYTVPDEARRVDKPVDCLVCLAARPA